jgi:hypothetical protein
MLIRASVPVWVLLLGRCALFVLGPPDVVSAQEPGEVRPLVPVEGMVTDRISGEPMEGVAITLRHIVRAELPSVITDRAGRFRIPAVPLGLYRMEATRVGYHEVRDSMVVTGEGTVRIEVAMVAAAIELEPVVVTATRRLTPEMREFEERRERGIGRFLSRDDIERLAPYRVSDLFRRMPGLHVEPGPRGRGGDVFMRGGCRPAVFVDGMRSATGPLDIDGSVSTGDLEAVEVYSASEAPMRFAYGSCGSIVLWTRPGGSEEGEPFSFRRLFVAAGILAGFLLLR